ncbi:MAG: hypothetical protein JWM47_1239 [Acidimicrobiales bacterium]|nr:hypothetical protein [Acidimicrobiales bacterium]
MTAPRRTYSLREAAEATGLGRERLRRLAGDGKLPSAGPHVPGTDWRLDAEKFDEMFRDGRIGRIRAAPRAPGEARASTPGAEEPPIAPSTSPGAATSHFELQWALAEQRVAMLEAEIRRLKGVAARLQEAVAASLAEDTLDRP